MGRSIRSTSSSPQARSTSKVSPDRLPTIETAPGAGSLNDRHAWEGSFVRGGYRGDNSEPSVSIATRVEVDRPNPPSKGAALATDSIETEGAEIFFDYEGSGPTLLLITGGGGGSNRYAGISERLADQYTVVRYDRRCNFRSTGDTSADLDMSQQARDAVAVIRAFGDQAYVFGNSGGANISLQLAIDTPEVITSLIAHEPPVMGLLPDRNVWFAFIDYVRAIYEYSGPVAAMHVFTSGITGSPTVMPDGSREDLGGGPGHHDDGEWFMAHEYVPISKYTPDLDRVSRAGRPMATAAGVISGDAYYARTARLVAERLAIPYFDFPGHHISFVDMPDEFAASIREAFAAIGPVPS